MMYNNKLVAVLKVNGNILREDKDVVHIPFGSEYTIQLKNLHTTRAVVNISVDGEDVCDESRYIISPQDTVEIEGFLKGQRITNKFKFIEKTSEISNFRGDQMEDGLIRIDFQFEAEVKGDLCINNYWYDPRSIQIGSGTGGRPKKFNSPGEVTYGSSSACDDSYVDRNAVYSCNLDSIRSIGATSDITNDVYNGQESDSGITARGSESSQVFNTTTVGLLESTKHSMVFQLRGMSNGQMLQHALTVNRKIQCENCGRKWKSSFNSCGNCGTSLR